MKEILIKKNKNKWPHVTPSDHHMSLCPTATDLLEVVCKHSYTSAPPTLCLTHSHQTSGCLVLLQSFSKVTNDFLNVKSNGLVFILATSQFYLTQSTSPFFKDFLH